MKSMSSTHMASEIRHDLLMMEQMRESIGYMDYTITGHQMGQLVELIKLREKLNNTPKLAHKDPNVLVDRKFATISPEVESDRERRRVILNRVNELLDQRPNPTV